MGKRNKSGFTLIELLVVIAIIAILVAILMPVISSVQEKGRQARCQANLMQIAAALRVYKTDYHRYPFRPYYDANTGSYAGGVSALYPDYLTNKANLMCPNDVSNLRGVQNVPGNYSTYNGRIRGIVDSSQSGADFWRFAAQNAAGQYPNGAAGDATVRCCITYNYGGFNNYGWDQSYWDTANSRWAAVPAFNAAAPAWLVTDGKKRRHWPRLGNHRAPDNTIVVHCVAHRKWYGKDDMNASPQPGKWRDPFVRVGAASEVVDYQPYTVPKTAGAAQWQIQE